MHCNQIQPLLSDYASSSLPAYKVAWVAQHLAACGHCRTQAEQVRHHHPSAVPEAAAAASDRTKQAPPAPALVRRGEVSVAIQRPVPVWLQFMVFLVVAAVTALSAWLLIARAQAPVAPGRPPRPAGAQTGLDTAAPQSPSRGGRPPADRWSTQAPPPVARPWYEAETNLAPYWPDATVGR